MEDACGQNRLEMEAVDANSRHTHFHLGVRQKYLPENAPKTLLYPFAGGDFFYANLFYPNRDTIIMIGLEPVGTGFEDSTVAPPNGRLPDCFGSVYVLPAQVGIFPHVEYGR